VGGQHHTPAALPPVKTQYPLYRRLGGTQGRSGRVRKISAPPGVDPRTVQPVASCYTDWATWPTTVAVWMTLKGSVVTCVPGIISVACIWWYSLQAVGSYTDTPQSWNEKKRRSSFGAAATVRIQLNVRTVHCLMAYNWPTLCTDYTSQQDFVPRKVYCVSNVTFHAESKYAIESFPLHTVLVQWNFLLLIFRNFSYFLQWFFLHEQIF
jgi:hypothetical protein